MSSRGFMRTGNSLTIPRPGTRTSVEVPPTGATADVGVWCAALALTVYLGLSGGGFDLEVRSEIGLVIWWAVLLGVLVGLLPRARLPRAGFIAAALLTAFLAWSWIGLTWSGSHELTLDTVCQLSTYLGTLLIGLCLLTPRSARALVGGLACGITVVSAIALLSKLAPSLFPANTARSFYAVARLSYPFDYADGVGEFAALGIPLLLYLAGSGRALATRAAAGAGLPVLLLCLAMTVSRGGILAAAVGLVVFFALAPDRIPRFTTLAVAGGGIAVLMVALLHRPALRDQIAAAPVAQRHSMLVALAAVVVLSGLAHLGLALIGRRIRRPGWTVVSLRAAGVIWLAILAAVCAVVVVGLAGGTASHLWAQFKQVNPSTHSNQYFRLLSLAGSHRYQYWQVALKAFDSSPLHGIGPGTYRFYWAAHQTIGEYVQNAHSLWFETLAEAGVIGLALIAGFFIFVLGAGGSNALRTADVSTRALLAAAVAGVAAFCGAASFDWIWQIGIAPMVTLLLVAVAVGPTVGTQPAARWPQPTSRWRRRWPHTGLRWVVRVPLAVGTLVAIALIAIPLASTVAVRSSQTAA
ncbi:MAG: O-antigen ligase family protein, partial [Solirubrobacteraceae bacterium]